VGDLLAGATGVAVSPGVRHRALLAGPMSLAAPGAYERLATAVYLPLITHTDPGDGNAINAPRTVAAYQRAGVTGIRLEDQVMPKKCGTDGSPPPLAQARVRELGIMLVMFPIGTLLAATAGIRALLARLRSAGTPTEALPELASSSPSSPT